jgi:hypothetical protein
MSKEKKTAISTITEICQTSFTLTPYSSQVNNPPRIKLGKTNKRAKRTSLDSNGKWVAIFDKFPSSRNSLNREKEAEVQAKMMRAMNEDIRKRKIL